MSQSTTSRRGRSRRRRRATRSGWPPVRRAARNVARRSTRSPCGDAAQAPRAPARGGDPEAAHRLGQRGELGRGEAREVPAAQAFGRARDRRDGHLPGRARRSGRGARGRAPAAAGRGPAGRAAVGRRGAGVAALLDRVADPVERPPRTPRRTSRRGPGRPRGSRARCRAGPPRRTGRTSSDRAGEPLGAPGPDRQPGGVQRRRRTGPRRWRGRGSPPAGSPRASRTPARELRCPRRTSAPHRGCARPSWAVRTSTPRAPSARVQLIASATPGGLTSSRPRRRATAAATWSARTSPTPGTRRRMIASTRSVAG